MTLPNTLLLFVFAITSGTVARSCKSPQKTSSQTSQAPQSAKSKVPQVTVVQMSRGYCFGKCPVYDIRIENSGLVRYSGRKFVEKEGIYEKSLDKATIENLLREFTKARIDTMQNSYESLVSDLPSIQYAVTFSDGKTKYIQNAHFGPQLLPRLAYQVDDLVKSPDYSWKRIATKVEE